MGSRFAKVVKSGLQIRSRRDRSVPRKGMDPSARHPCSAEVSLAFLLQLGQIGRQLVILEDDAPASNPRLVLHVRLCKHLETLAGTLSKGPGTLLAYGHFWWLLRFMGFLM